MKLPPLSQKWFDENRQLFNAETTIAENTPPQQCKHEKLIFKGTNVECAQCFSGWIGLAPHLASKNS